MAEGLTDGVVEGDGEGLSDGWVEMDGPALGFSEGADDVDGAKLGSDEVVGGSLAVGACDVDGAKLGSNVGHVISNAILPLPCFLPVELVNPTLLSSSMLT